MSNLTETKIENFAIDLLKTEGYDYLFRADIQ